VLVCGGDARRAGCGSAVVMQDRAEGVWGSAMVKADVAIVSSGNGNDTTPFCNLELLFSSVVCFCRSEDLLYD
jgi:hypothetical protein